MLSAVPKGEVKIHGKSQGYRGLPVRHELRNTVVDGSYTPVMVTAWTPTPDELAALNAGASVMVEIAGQVPPPMNVRVGDEPE